MPMSILRSMWIVWVFWIQFLSSRKVTNFSSDIILNKMCGYREVSDSQNWYLQCFHARHIQCFSRVSHTWVRSVASGVWTCCRQHTSQSLHILRVSCEWRYLLSHTITIYVWVIFFGVISSYFSVVFDWHCLTAVSGGIPAAASFALSQCWSQSIQRYTPCLKLSDSWTHYLSQKTLIWSRIFHHFEMIRLGKMIFKQLKMVEKSEKNRFKNLQLFADKMNKVFINGGSIMESLHRSIEIVRVQCDNE
jgi:hypothetical protein